MECVTRRFEEIFIKNSYYKQYFLSVIAVGLGYGLYKGVIDNYLAEIISMGEFDRGVAEFFRELPGVILIFILALLYTWSAEKIYKIGIIIMTIGMTLHGILPANRVWITVAIFLYSIGDHIGLGMRSTLTLQYAHPEHAGKALGQQNAAYQIGNLVGYAVILVSFLFVAGRRAFVNVFFISAAIMAFAAVMALKIKGSTHVDSTKQRFYFRRKFTKYYILEIFYGARKQVFFTFGPYVLILFYGASTSVIGFLFVITAICGFVISPLVGKLIDQVGYKIIMISDTLILVIVCFFYGYAHYLFAPKVAFIVCCINYVLDSVISLASMASSVYVADLSESPEEMRATITTGVSVNHVVTVFIALFGGYIWSSIGIEALFTISALLGIGNSIFAATIKTKKA